LQKLFKAKKGISPILATLLLIVIAVAAIVVTYAWVMTFMGSQTSAAGVKLNEENVYWNSTASTTNIIIRNTGTSDAKIQSLYLGETPLNLVPVTAFTDLGTGKLLPIDQTLTIVLSWPNTLASSWTNGETYYFRIAPESGAPLEFTWKAPSS
jgi:flagellin-like protein